ncbi:MAG: hypothetical protein Q4A84_05215 [Neisseria sp.]|uniref:hypothetical protein n=1 Tax=Neisseria sp. TaxID=192066 RepID=UPI0026DB2950|nr:hypothetical protein [Neisseria sp.]MDO4641087.1 hypothetical protein [Neisseria sp.]
MDEKEKFQFNLMKDIILSMTYNDSVQLDRFILEYDFNEEQQNLLLNILDEFANKENFTYSKFERCLREIFGWSYQIVLNL